MKKISITVISLFIILLLYMVHLFVLDKELDYQDILIANQDISPKSMLNESMFDVVSIPNNQYRINYLTSYVDIKDQVSNIDSKITKGSFVSTNQISSIESLKDSSHLLLSNNETLFPLAIDHLEATGLSLSTGYKVDIYIIYKPYNKDIIVDKLLSNIKVLSIKDHNGLDTSSLESDQIPFLINLAIPNDYLNMIIKAQQIAKIKVYVSSEVYNIDNEVIFNEESTILKYIK